MEFKRSKTGEEEVKVMEMEEKERDMFEGDE